MSPHVTVVTASGDMSDTSDKGDKSDIGDMKLQKHDTEAAARVDAARVEVLRSMALGWENCRREYEEVEEAQRKDDEAAVTAAMLGKPHRRFRPGEAFEQWLRQGQRVRSGIVSGAMKEKPPSTWAPFRAVLDRFEQAVREDERD